VVPRAAAGRELSGQAGSSRLREDADWWRVPVGLAKALFVLPLLAGFVVAASRLDKGLFRALTGEDGVLEWLQVACYATAAVFGLVTGLRLLRSGHRWPGLWFLALAAGCVFVTGEEVAWGQRILGIETPEALEAINDQDEVTLHNIGDLQNLLNAVQLAVGVAGATAGWWLARSSSRVPRLLVPPVFLSSAFAVVAAWRVLRFLDVPPSSFSVVEYGEFPELCLAGALALTTVLAFRRADTWRRQATTAEDRSSGG
jgi:hypothetical protein